MMRVLVTGAHGFIGKNLVTRLKEIGDYQVTEFLRTDEVASLFGLVADADAIVHLAGVNRPANPNEFEAINADLTAVVCQAIKSAGRAIPLLLASSTQAELDNPYGQSKRKAEQFVEELVAETANPVRIYRLPGVFGKWCRPNYNSVVATFCYNIARGQPIQISDPAHLISLVYIDDVIESFLSDLNDPSLDARIARIEPEYSITLGDLASQIYAFGNSRETLVSEPVGKGLTRALYATYLSYLPPDRFAYDLPLYGDQRGVFVEMLKTPNAGQFSYFTAHPGVTRGGHYHHTKSEKFLVIRGKARFCFRDVQTNEIYTIETAGGVPQVVETVPGWTHDITNIGDEEMIVMLWANEIFDRDRPDTITCKV